tara:strand:+ start:232 stop:597 length:366 start_codon:yes stop_codon:yes gene_type:complete
MIKTYYKSMDIKNDIKNCERLRRKYSAGSKEYKEITKELDWLKGQKKALDKKNKGNAAYWHNGIPPRLAKKPKALTAKAEKQRRRLYLQHEISIYTEKEQAITEPAITEHLDALKKQLASI